MKTNWRLLLFPWSLVFGIWIFPAPAAPAAPVPESPIPSTEFVAYRKSAGEQPLIILGDALGQRVLLKDYAVPIYFGYPTRSYRILGAVITHGSSQGGEDEAPRPVIMRSIASAAKLHGAEAVIMLRLTDADRQAADADGRPWIVAKAIAITWRRPGDS